MISIDAVFLSMVVMMSNSRDNAETIAQGSCGDVTQRVSEPTTLFEAHESPWHEVQSA
jgi:hypothetical protein